MANEDLLASAVIALIVSRGGRAYDLDDAKKLTAPPASYVQVTVERRAGGDARLTGGHAVKGYRIEIREIGTTVSNARNARVKGDLENVALTVDGTTSTRLEFETQQAIAQDNDWWSGFTVWTCAF